LSSHCSASFIFSTVEISYRREILCFNC